MPSGFHVTTWAATVRPRMTSQLLRDIVATAELGVVAGDAVDERDDLTPNSTTQHERQGALDLEHP